jgi:hypothetical protein
MLPSPARGRGAIKTPLARVRERGNQNSPRPRAGEGQSKLPSPACGRGAGGEGIGMLLMLWNVPFHFIVIAGVTLLIYATEAAAVTLPASERRLAAGDMGGYAESFYNSGRTCS